MKFYNFDTTLVKVRRNTQVRYLYILPGCFYYIGYRCRKYIRLEMKEVMKKSTALKQLLRAPLKTLLTFLLIAAASFALFSRVTDFAVTMRENKEIEGFYHAKASLDNYVPSTYVETEYVSSPNGWASTGYGFMYKMQQKPEPTKEQMEEFKSLPGVSLVDKNYLTAGRVEDYKRLDLSWGWVLFEGTFEGYEDEYSNPSILRDHVTLKFDDVKVIGCQGGPEIPQSFTVGNVPLGDMYYAKSPYTRAYYDNLKTGSRCLMLAMNSGNRRESDNESGIYFRPQDFEGAETLRVIDGEPENYLETESFALQKSWLDAIEHNQHAFEVRYGTDMRTMARESIICEGRYFTQEDTDVCVVSAEFLEEYGLSVGDRIRVRLGDQAYHDFLGPYAETYTEDEGEILYPEKIPEYVKTAEVTIIGAYTDPDKNVTYPMDKNVIYLSSSVMPEEIANMEPEFGDITLFVEDAHDIEAFHKAAEEFVEKVGCDLIYSDRGWLEVKDSLRMGELTAFLTTFLYVAGAVLALFLAVYLYIGRSKKTYAIMRTLGVPGKAAEHSVVLPFVAVSVLAVPVGGIAGLSYAQNAAAKTIAQMADSAPIGYVPDAKLPTGVIIFCLLAELLFVSLSAYSFLRSMKHTPPLELLQDSARIKAAKKAKKAEPVPVVEETVLAKADISKLSVAGEGLVRGNYGAVRHVISYIRRHMRRGVAKTAVSLVLAIVLAAGIGTLVLAKVTYRDAYYQQNVMGRATAFSLTSARALSNSPLIKDFYCHDTFAARVEGLDSDVIMSISNDLMRYMGDCTVDYAEGYDISAFEGTAQICLVGKETAEELGISPGDEIGILSSMLYAMLQKGVSVGEDVSGYKPYKVIGIVESGDANINKGIFTGIRCELQRLFSMDFDVDVCEFILADNDKVEETDALLEQEQDKSIIYSPGPDYRIDTGGLENIRRIRALLDSLFPIAVAAAVLIGVFGPLLVILQSAQEAAFLRILGVTKKRTRCILVFEQIFLCMAAVVLMAALFVLYSPGIFVSSLKTLAFCWGLYLLGGSLGAVAASVLVTRHKALELLQVKE